MITQSIEIPALPQVSFMGSMTSALPCQSSSQAQEYLAQQKLINCNSHNNRTQSLIKGEHIRMKAINCQQHIFNAQKDSAQNEIENINQSIPNYQRIYTCPQETMKSKCNSFTEHFRNITFAQVPKINKQTSNEDNYLERIISSMKKCQREPTDFLKAHSISKEVRAKMVDWMIEVTTSYDCSNETFFLAVSYMDHYFEKCQRQLSAQELHLTGVTSMFIACKYQEVYPLQLQTFYQKIGHKKLSITDIKKREQEILQVIEYDLSSPTILSFVEIAVHKLCLQDHLNASHLDFFWKMCIYLSKMVCHEYNICKEHSISAISGAVIYVSFKILQQMHSGFDIIQLIQNFMRIITLNNEEILKASTLLLALARTFEKQYPNLHNLRKSSSEIQNFRTTPEQVQTQIQRIN